MTSWTAACKASLSFTISWSLLKFMSIELVMPFNHLILCRPLLLLPSIFLNIRVFSSKLAFHIRWPKYWSFSFSISPSNGYSGLSSFRIDWFDLLTVQGTLKNLWSCMDVSWTVKKAERRRIDAFELWCWRRLLRVPWTARRSSQSVLKEITPKYLLEGLILKLQYFGHLL